MDGLYRTHALYPVPTVWFTFSGHPNTLGIVCKSVGLLATRRLRWTRYVHMADRFLTLMI
jgi:hypothetical protein